ncbi:MAG: ribonuclease HII [Candidatus Pelagibacter sp.]|nr:ribonuclease HII [Candidatus Pelagibacter sp.]OUW24537.1 MAG: ribonuclease HII [Rickettsiales bacterium TMED174]
MSKNKNIAGVDEVGRGCIAGPVVAAAVIFKEKIKLKSIKDSKKISFNNRYEISEYIKENSFYGIGIASVKEIARLNILQASLLAMKRALLKLSVKPGLVLIDGNFAPKGIKNYKTIIKGDEKIKEISAASIVAKCYRDLLMIELSKKFKKYYWNKNFGYGTKQHLLSLKKYGTTKLHREKFSPIHQMLTK